MNLHIILFESNITLRMPLNDRKRLGQIGTLYNNSKGAVLDTMLPATLVSVDRKALYD